jgi:hypothetical protein
VERKEIWVSAHNRGERLAHDAICGGACNGATPNIPRESQRGAADKEKQRVTTSTALTVLLAATLGIGQTKTNSQQSPMAKPVQARPVQRVKPAEPPKDTTFKGKKAYVYFRENELTWKIGNDVLERTIRFDRDAGGLRTTEIKTMGGLPKIDSTSTTEGEFSVIGADAQKRGPYHLDHDWAYIWQSVGTPSHEGRVLTIHLQGVRSNSGLEVEVLYEVLPGNRPYLGKSITLINRGDAPVSLADVVFDRWILPAPSHPARAAKSGTKTTSSKPEDFSASGDFSMGVEDAANRIGLRAFMTGKNGEISFTNGTVVPRFTGPEVAPPNGGRAYTPFAVIFPYSGTAERGNMLYQKYEVASAPTPGVLKERNP